MKVQAIRKSEGQGKSLQPNQKSVDAIPFGSGTWRVEGIPGLFLRARARSKSFLVQRRREGRLLTRTLGPVSMREAKDKAMREWSALKAKPATAGVTLNTAIEDYIESRTLDGKMAPRTKVLAEYNAKRHLAHWADRTLEEIALDRAGLTLLRRRLKSPAVCNQVLRLLSAVYNYNRERKYPNLPEWPKKVAEVHAIAARDWNLTAEELIEWWRGVQTLTPMKRAWWQVALLTGGRRGSIEALRWTDIDIEKKTLRFAIAKGGRAYTVPISDTLAAVLTKYRDSGDVPPSPWLFPSSVLDASHMRNVRDAEAGPAHALRHTFRTTLAELGATVDQAKLLLGHSLRSDVSSNYITATSPLLIESLRPLVNTVAEHYRGILKVAL